MFSSHKSFLEQFPVTSVCSSCIQLCHVKMYLQESSLNSKEPEATESHPPVAAKSIKPRAPKPPAPQPPAPTAVSATPASISIAPAPVPPVSVSVGGWERSQSTLPSVGNTVDEMFSSSLMSKPSNPAAAVEKEEEGSPNVDSATFSQVSPETARASDSLLDLRDFKEE